MFQDTLSNIKKQECSSLQKLRGFVENDFDVNGDILTTDENLMRFLYSRQLNVQATYSLIKNFVQYKKDNPNIFENLSIHAEDIRTALEHSLPELHPHKDRKCRSIIIFHANNWDGTFTLNAIYRALLLCLDYALEDIHTQNNGFVIIVNWEQFTFKKSTWIIPSFINSMIYGLQSCYPAKFLELHFIASSWYINAAFNVFKLSFNDEIRENFYVHGRNLSALHEYIHKEVLPTELGGNKPSFNSAKLIEELEIFVKKISDKSGVKKI
ncbi:hypothetical protein HHI36_014224 [Cryptolaemus montrouzieri]|uniref:CRAL-TRIO domain-containing protein n=1 Tax=Cryptolaemus montrouzieri TaxID=559131 RepID=A0ABD2N1W0_9CUCU